MKAIIPVAGAGTTLRPFTYTQPKALIPLAGNTILGFIIEQMLELGVTEFVFVIGHLGEKIQDFIAQHYSHIKAYFAVQHQRSGTGHAVFLAKEFIAPNEPVIVVYGDTICDFDTTAFMDTTTNCFLVKKVDDPTDFGIVVLDDKQKIKQVVEKPKVPKSNLALVGIYKFVDSTALFTILEKELLSSGLEKYYLTDAIEAMIKQGYLFDYINTKHWYDCGKKDSLLETNANLLKKLEFASDEVPFFENTIIIHPVSIADGCDIQNSIIGPNVTIGEQAKIQSSIVSNSIIGAYTVMDTIVLNNSLIGSDTFVRGNSQSLNIGDNTEIDLK
jgi:glucose-1-phosphate thymidylyltransferase